MIKMTTEENKKEEIIDDIFIDSVVIDKNKLKNLKDKNKRKEKMTKDKTLNFGVVATGQAGGKIAEAFYKLGYDCIALNTAQQDLKYIDIPEQNKLLLEYGLGGAAKEMDIGKAAAEKHLKQIKDLVSDKLSEAQVYLLCLSLGGGSGAGSCEPIIDLLYSLNKPVLVITVLPMDTEDTQTKNNALQTLGLLSKMVQMKKVSNLIVVDNARLETIYHDISQTNFYNVANKAIVQPLDVFNTLSSMPSSVKPLDAMEWSKLLVDGEGLSIYGELTVENYAEDTAIAEAVVENLSNNLLAQGFDLKQSKYVGVIIAANEKVWSKIPASSVNYASAMVNEVCGTPKAFFKGIYTIDNNDDNVKVYSFFSGLGLPISRVEQLKKDAQKSMVEVKAKEDLRSSSLNLDVGVDDTVSAAQKMKDKISTKSSAFGKLFGNTVVDRRK